MNIKIHYFAKLREERGCSSETVETNVSSALELYNELKTSYRFSFEPGDLKVAINDEFKNWDAILKNNDTVVFIQPVAGG